MLLAGKLKNPPPSLKVLGPDHQLSTLFSVHWFRIDIIHMFDVPILFRMVITIPVNFAKDIFRNLHQS